MAVIYQVCKEIMLIFRTGILIISFLLGGARQS